MAESQPLFSEHRIQRDVGGSLYVRDYSGSGPALILMHGFPDNLHIWDDLIPYLVAAGRRVVAFDFLGFGASDKQQQRFRQALPDSQRAHFNSFIGPLIRDNFVVQPGAGPAFVQLSAQFSAEHARNAQRLAELKTLDVPVKLIWGKYDPYIAVAVAEHRLSQLNKGSLTVIPAGHWLQADEPAQVAKAMLS
jgi:pimeloyl-ACP methyl ester carboxylesterase